MRGPVSAILICVSAVWVAAAQQQQPPPPTQPPRFTSGVTVVPLDIRVIDRNGKPIADLKPSDFTILEDGVAQKIVHFSFHQLDPVAPPADERPALRKPLGETVAPQNHRTFLLVLGRGRQVGPVRGVEAAIQFVKERLLPQDRVAILAYNRATDFTTDHKTALATLDRYRKQHEAIEAKLRHHFSGLAAAYARREIPPSIQPLVDAIFEGEHALASRSVSPGGIAGETPVAVDRRRQRDLIQRAELASERQALGVATPFDQSAIDEAAMLDEGFDEYVEKSVDTESDMGNLYAGVRYLRWLDGEKHLVYLTPGGLFLPRLEQANSLAAFANDARVAVDIIHTGGLGAAQRMVTSRTPGVPPRIVRASGFGEAAQTGDSRQIASLTGGQMMTFRAGDAFFKRLDETTRAQYLLGYTPSNGAWDGKYRRIEVKVSRKGAQVLYRHGYRANREVSSFNRTEYLAYSRIASAANYDRDVTDLKMTMENVTVQAAKPNGEMAITIQLAPGAVRLAARDGMHVGKAEILVFCGDRNERLVGEAWQTMDFNLTESNHARFVREGAGITLRIPLTGEPVHVKAIVYDYNADLIGSASRKLDQKK